MNLGKKKELAARTFGVSRKRILFPLSRQEEIKEAITKQDIRDLVAKGAIIIKQIKGRRAVIRKKSRRLRGNVRITPRRRKAKYVILTRKLRAYSKGLKGMGEISEQEHVEIRKKIRNSEFKSKAGLKEYLGEVKKTK